ncbi:hypothetical protein [Actinomadura chibensis]|uniref:Uncharacterized protein n=1 Tax=Actinomadura chibensis TaxID=392828 RepID=A0A5D0NMB8_9ACTN|nr:hypothetical protein [Actinomadura chibensis]TYB45602.1 hypothetical protein FXF69_19440 [Actinomadura chibensis]
MRAFIVVESLTDTGILDALPGTLDRRYPFTLNNGPVELVEYDVPDDDALPFARTLSENLLPTRYYGHLVGDNTMIVAFPHVIALVDRGDKDSATKAQQVGALFDIPAVQLQVARMFEVDHPDVDTPSA